RSGGGRNRQRSSQCDEQGNLRNCHAPRSSIGCFKQGDRVLDVRQTLPEVRARGTHLSDRHPSGVSRGQLVHLTPTDAVPRLARGQDGAARIAAMVTIEALPSAPRIRKSHPGFAAAAVGLATPQIRSVGTLGGNLAQRSRCWYFRKPHLACLKKG